MAQINGGQIAARPQQGLHGTAENTTLLRTRCDKVVEALGGHGELAEKPDEIRPALDRALASGKPALVNVMIRQDGDYDGGIYV